MTADERRPWWRRLIDPRLLPSRLLSLPLPDLARARARTARPSREALVADAVLAAVLTVAALLAAGSGGAGDQAGDRAHPVSELLRLGAAPLTSVRLPTPPTPPTLPTPPELPKPPEPGRPGDIRIVPALPDLGPAPGEDEPGPPLALAALTTLPLAARRRYPLGTFWAVMAAALAMTGAQTWITVAAVAVAAYSAVAHGRDRVPAVASLLLAAVLAGAAARGITPSVPSALGPYVVLVSAGALAGFIRFWRHSRSRIDEMRRAQEEAMREAVQAERSRIAGELHDVVTHNVSVMVIQAGAARKVMDTHPEQSREALVAIEAGGRAAMAELRHVMGLLAGSESAAAGTGDGLEPQPGLDRLDGLVERVRAAGLPVDATVCLPEEPLPAGVELAAYRVVQEALTNTMKHAAGAAAAVTIGHRGGGLEIEVTDTGGAPGPQSRTGNGRGLIGLRERVALYGGTLEAAPMPGGGFRLRAEIPWRQA
ncbi:sensor histidine kinase [Nonomuraea roseoviolacea]|uniref:histidine kinase n=3 Tax=Nonomuraea TaxID=83681 RepID=A0ABT1KBD5_9ACTN|nr:histidine kinase [Nonomuraea roseoviolacea]MCP2351332.1 signal transduction histidine kinase [Nonomuraea roseoviolacea subsp. carminata]